jgi:hypothetical protein
MSPTREKLSPDSASSVYAHRGTLSSNGAEVFWLQPKSDSEANLARVSEPIQIGRVLLVPMADGAIMVLEARV